MTLRRMGVAVPLAILVAAVAHVAGFGADHLPGATHAAGLLTTLAATLGLVGMGTLFVAALRAGRRDARPRQQAFWPMPLLLAAGAAIAYGAIELAEGHTPFGGGLRALISFVPAAASVSWLARLAARLLRFSGAALAAFAARSLRCLPPFTFAPALHSLLLAGTNVGGARYGRAPPILA